MENLTTSLHENSLVIDYIKSHSFNGFEIKIKDNIITFSTDDHTLLSVLKQCKIVKEDDLSVDLDISILLPKKSNIKKCSREFRWQYEPEVVSLNETLNAIYSFSDPTVKDRLAEGIVHYGDLPVLFSGGNEIIATTSSGLVGGIVESCNEAFSMFGNYYNIITLCILPSSKGPCFGKVHHRVYDFDGSVMSIDKLNVRPISEDEKTLLKERGKKFLEFTKNPTPAMYNGILTVPSWFRDSTYGAQGRVMVDSINISQIDADVYENSMRSLEINQDSCGLDIKEEDLWRCYNRVHGFSMRLKRWGWLDIDYVQPIKWRDDAFNQVVLDEKYKTTIINLVKNYGNSFSDFIDGKSGGLVFLLNGPPGVGKTLLSEAVAEHLHRPLYSISVGELGTNASDLENNLRNVLDLAYQWNAVLLLDEADIFMEARDTNNIERNAMVSIFLRLLEYYAGVMFLTTNRVNVFDDAFFSRISLAINFDHLQKEERKQIWKNILLVSGVALDDTYFIKEPIKEKTWFEKLFGKTKTSLFDPLTFRDFPKFDLEKLSEYNVNGRNIKTAVRIAQTVCSGENRCVTQDDVIRVIEFNSEFNDERNK